MSKKLSQIICLIMTVFSIYLQAVNFGYEVVNDDLNNAIDTVMRTCTNSYIDEEEENYR